MKKYYFFDGTTQHGPFTLEELRAYNINPQTSVWFDSIPQWKPAGEIQELQILFNTISMPASVNPPATQVDWNNIDFYFMDNIGTQQGPFKISQLAGRNITAQTQVWYEPLPKWTTAGEIAALKNILSSGATATTTTTAAVQSSQIDWNNLDFYFMDGSGTQQGPFKISQLAGRNITAQTQVWYEPLPKWTTAGEIAALKNVLSSAAATTTATVQPSQIDWNNKDFYFMDSSGTQQGPLKINQLAGRNITAQTQVWYDPLPKWASAGEIAALKSILSSAAAATTTNVQSSQIDWNNKDFYFMDGAGTQQGPFKISQLAGKNITTQTQVWYDPLPKWTTAGEIAALKSALENGSTAAATTSSATVQTEDWTKKQFFIADGNGAQQGPLTLKQLEDKNITEATSIWYDPLPSWTTASEVPALKKVIDAVKARMEEWRNKFYFISDASGTRQGPFKLDQLKDKNINAQTPIWYDPLTEWTTAGEIPALKTIL